MNGGHAEFIQAGEFRHNLTGKDTSYLPKVPLPL